MKIAIYSSDNGVGLTRDASILTNILTKAGHSVWFQDWKERKAITADVNIHLELINTHAVSHAYQNIFIPNPEWYDMQFNGFVKKMDFIFAKTEDCKKIFSRIHQKVYYTGFTSQDRYMPDVKKEVRFAHFAGKSMLKGTKAVIRASEIAGIQVDIFRYGLSDDEFRLKQNKYLIHLCPSEYEGFGHYINEAKSCAAFIITTNHAPMNELITSETGIGVAPSGFYIKSLATCATIDTFALAAMLKQVSGVKPGILASIGLKARESYIHSDKLFTNRIIEWFEKLK